MSLPAAGIAGRETYQYLPKETADTVNTAWWQ
jgi:hypothetical protein